MPSLKAALIFQDQAAVDHWTTSRTFRRAGLDKSHFDIILLEDALVKLNAKPYLVAVAFGERCLQAIGQQHDILRWHNRVLDVKLKDRTIPVVFCIQPQSLIARRGQTMDVTGDEPLRNPPRYTGTVVRLLRLYLLAPGDNLGTPIAYDNFLLDPTPIRFGEWADSFFAAAAANSDLILYWDIETNYKMQEDDESEYEEEKRREDDRIIRISFHFAGGQAVSVPYLPEYYATITRLLAYTGFHGGWNFVAFDRPLVERNGHPVGGIMLDFMDGWHLIETDLDRGIEFVSGFADGRILPWKQLSAVEPAKYSAIDSYVCEINGAYIIRKLKERGLYDRFLKEMSNIRTLAKCGERGSMVDDEFRKMKLVEFEGMYLERIIKAQDLVHERFLRRKMYVRLPKGAVMAADGGDWHPHAMKKSVKVCSHCEKERVSIKHKCPVSPEWQKKDKVIDIVAFYRKPDISGYTLPEMEKYLSQNGFNPASSHQMKAYMRFHKHPVGTNHKTKQDSADTKHLQTLIVPYGAKHPIYAHTLDIKKLQKALSYCYGLEPDANGMCHTTYVNSPSTWRLGSRNVNVQQLGKRASNKYAKEMRKAIIPRPGHVLVQADSSAIEQVFVGKYMEDPSYIRLARMGVHAHLSCKWMKIESTPENRRKVKDNHKDIYERIKNNVHGISFGMGPWLMAKDYPDLFPTVKDAQVIQDFIFREVPGLKNWQHMIRVNAQKTAYVDNAWGLRHYFYDVFTYQHDDDGNLIMDDEGLPKIKKGKDHNRAIAFKPQSSAAMFMRDNIYLMSQSKWAQYMPAVVSIHDGYTLDVPMEMAKEAADYLTQLLCRPIAELGGLRVGCEVEVSAPNLLHEGGTTGNFLDLKMVRIVEIGDDGNLIYTEHASL